MALVAVVDEVALNVVVGDMDPDVLYGDRYLQQVQNRRH